MDSLLCDSSHLHVGSEPQFLIDDLFVESVQYLTRRMHHPTKESGAVLRKDRPWEHVTYFSTNTFRVLRDPTDGIFKCWYQDWTMGYEDFRKRHDWYEGSLAWPSRCLYAQSEDGIRWEKPPVGFEEENRRTNIVCGDKEFGPVHAPFVFLDPLETDAQRRFKMLFQQAGNWTTNVMWRGKMLFAASPDGIRWEKWRMAPDLDDVLTIAFDDDSRSYLVNTRHPEMYTVALDDRNPASTIKGPMPPYYPHQPFRQNKRRVHRYESHDLEHWSKIQPLLAPDDETDNLDDSFYGMVQFRRGGIWIGLLTVFHMTENRKDLQLVYSRDGRSFKRVQPGVRWLSPGEAGSWDQCSVMTPSPPVEVGDELYVYYGGTSNHHDWWVQGMNEGIDDPEAKDISRITYSMGLARMKIDRFVSLTAGRAREGILVTRPFFSKGGALRVNGSCKPGGYCVAQLADVSGQTVSGFEREECSKFTGDSVSHLFRWNRRAELPPGWMKLHFFLRDADLFTFQVGEPSGS